MAIVHACDATGKVVDEKELVEVGVRGRVYCGEMAVPMREYAKAVDDLHSRCAEAFQKELVSLRKTTRRKHKIPKTGKLPDE